MNPPYRTTRLDDGALEIRDELDILVVEDGEDQAYCDFLSWASRQPEAPHEGFSVPKNSHFFADPDALIEHLIQSSTLLSATYDAEETRGSLRTAELASVNHKHPFHLLYEATDGKETLNGFAEKRSRIYVSINLLARSNQEIQNDESEIRKVSSWPIERCFVYLDVSDFSKYPSGHQVLVINSIARVVQSNGLWEMPIMREVKSDLEAMICIGDGYIFVLKNALKTAIFAAHLANVIELMVAKELLFEFHFRMGAHVGRVFSFWDPGRNDWNYIGDGINGGQRVLGAVGKDTDDVVFISAQLRQKISAEPDETGLYPDVLGDAHNRGRRADKHGNSWRVYELNHTNLMSTYNYQLQDALYRFRD